eukprot:240638_1
MSNNWKYSTVPQTTKIVSNNVYTTRYPKHSKRYQATKQCCDSCCPAFWKTSCFILFGLCFLAVVGLIVYGGILVIQQGVHYESKNKNNDAFNSAYFSAECICVDESSENTTICDYKLNQCYTNEIWTYTFQLYDDNTDCDKYDNKTIFETKESYDRYNINDTKLCWVSIDCNKKYIDKTRAMQDAAVSMDDENGLIAALLYCASVIIFFTACCCCCMTVWYWNLFIDIPVESINYVDCTDCCNYWSGNDKNNYYRSQWKSMSYKQKCDYYISFYARKYDLNLGQDVYHTLYEYSDELVASPYV